MSADNLPGHSCGDGADDGAYQFPALDAAAPRVINLVDWVGRYVEVQWDGSARLYYGFFATEALADAGFDKTTATANHGAKVPTGPSWVRPTSDKQFRVPAGRTFLRLEPASGSERCIVRKAEGAPAEV